MTLSIIIIKLVDTSLRTKTSQGDTDTTEQSNVSSLAKSAKEFFRDAIKEDGKYWIESNEEEPEEYLWYKEAYLSDEELCEFYTKANSNPYGLLINEYLIIYNKDGNEVIDSGCWTGEKFRHLSYDNFNSNWFGMVKPIKNDIHQALFADSLTNNKITMVKGPAGSGKTYLSLAYLFSQLNKGNIDKIIVFCNTVATEHSAKLGYYPGSRDEKLLDSQIGN